MFQLFDKMIELTGNHSYERNINMFGTRGYTMWSSDGIYIMQDKQNQNSRCLIDNIMWSNDGIMQDTMWPYNFSTLFSRVNLKKSKPWAQILNLLVQISINLMLAAVFWRDMLAWIVNSRVRSGLQCICCAVTFYRIGSGKIIKYMFFLNHSEGHQVHHSVSSFPFKLSMFWPWR
jgi:hypothetical protein